ncbi:hypothetical protein D3C71_1799990 [compost metagenome]
MKIVFWGAGKARYDQYTALLIATVTFTELLVSLFGSMAARRNGEPVVEAIRLTNLASSFISLVLTQTAILSFAQERDVTFYNGLSGVIFGTLAALTGLYMLLRKSSLPAALS